MKINKEFLVQYPTFLKWQNTVSPDSIGGIVLIRTVKKGVFPESYPHKTVIHEYEFINKNNWYVKEFFGSVIGEK